MTSVGLTWLLLNFDCIYLIVLANVYLYVLSCKGGLCATLLETGRFPNDIGHFGPGAAGDGKCANGDV